jgi:hypothetical protein
MRVGQHFGRFFYKNTKNRPACHIVVKIQGPAGFLSWDDIETCICTHKGAITTCSLSV